jgi:ABC-type sugar transport system ATPase subunit
MQPLLHMRAISKAFPGVQALKSVELIVYPGEILGLLGENGAGKSTLMKILNGVYPADHGVIEWNGQPVVIHSPAHAQRIGIAMIHQELALIPYLDAAKNIYLGREPRGRLPGTIQWRRLYADAEQQMREIGIDLPIRTPVRFFSLAQQQMIEVAKALSLNARLIVMDEPTSSLTDREVEKLFAQMRQLRARGVSIIFISHRLEEVVEICDRVTVLRDGELVGSKAVAEVTTNQIIQMMVGRELDQTFERREHKPSDEVILQVRGLHRGNVIRNVSFDLRRGEILGIAGLVGAGRTELAQTLFGVYPATKGEIVLEGRPLRIQRPSQAIENGIGFVPENRKEEGLFLGLSVSENIVIAKLKQMVAGLLVRWGMVRQESESYTKRLNIRTPSVQQTVRNLSGGNQQKVVIAKWLTMNPKILILDEPTRGIDVNAKAEIHRLIRSLADNGVGILVISSELPEVIGISDRILVMHQGSITGEFDAATATQHELMQAAIGAAVSSKDPQKQRLEL